MKVDIGYGPGLARSLSGARAATLLVACVITEAWQVADGTGIVLEHHTDDLDLLFLLNTI